jgi:hypothetical protein
MMPHPYAAGNAGMAGMATNSHHHHRGKILLCGRLLAASQSRLSRGIMELSWIQISLLLAAIGAVAFLYSSVGHGGATGYLAVAALLDIAPALARPGALWMNCFVASVAFRGFQKAGLFDGRVFLPLACASVPMAWLGSHLHLEGRAYAAVLGLALLSAGWLLAVGGGHAWDDGTRPPALPLALMAGAGLGFLAGITGIGGGVYLTPLLIFLRWTPPKTAGGVSALFIVVNSIAGLAGLGREALIWEPVYMVAPAVGVAAAFAGTCWSVLRWDSTMFRKVLAVVLWIAAVKSLVRAFA